MDPTSLEALLKYGKTFLTIDLPYGWYLLLWQHKELPGDRNSDVLSRWTFPPFPWGSLMVPLWDVCTNWRVLQATVNVDNLPSFGPPSFPRSHHPACFYEYTRRVVADMNFGIGYNFTGCILEMVRTFLADWLHARPSDAPAPNWMPSLPTEPIELPFSPNHQSLIWECQCLLQESIANMDRSGRDMLSSPHLIMLFILAFPEVKRENLLSNYSADQMISTTSSGYASDDDNSSDDRTPYPYNYDFVTPFAPQNIRVNVKLLDCRGETNIRFQLVAEESEKNFSWAYWIDSAMGFIRGVDDLIADENPRTIPEHILNWRKRTPAKFDPDRSFVIVHQNDPELSDLPGDIPIWTAWPMFDIKVVQFEMNKWMQKTGLMHGFGDAVRPEIEYWELEVYKEVDRAEAGLLKIMKWNRL